MKLLLLACLLPLTSFASSQLGLELGTVSNTYNSAQVPGDSGTKFNLASSFKDQNYYNRIHFSHLFNDRHGLRLLYAPLELKGDKRYKKDINFEGVNFLANNKTKTTYRFDSYRATYFYRFVSDENFIFDLGGTLKIRDAEIKLKQDGNSKSKTNTGVVPLLYLFSEYKWSNDYRVALDFDGLAAPQGRAFDVAVMVGKYFGPSLHANLGLRMLEGGVDNDEVYNFAQLNYFFASVFWKF